MAHLHDKSAGMTTMFSAWESKAMMRLGGKQVLQGGK